VGWGLCNLRFNFSWKRIHTHIHNNVKYYMHWFLLIFLSYQIREMDIPFPSFPLSIHEKKWVSFPSSNVSISLFFPSFYQMGPKVQSFHPLYLLCKISPLGQMALPLPIRMGWWMRWWVKSHGVWITYQLNLNK
jgi:hypothetical protein